VRHQQVALAQHHKSNTAIVKQSRAQLKTHLVGCTFFFRHIINRTICDHSL